MKKTLIILAYLFGCILTNAYCQEHRWQDWEEIRHKQNTPTREENLKLTAATAFWPVYWTSRLCFKLVEFESPEPLYYIEKEIYDYT